jgi:repressor LexA
MDIAERIKLCREKLGLSYQDIADALGIHRTTAMRYETRFIQKVSLDKLENLAQVLKTTPEYLMGRDGSPLPSNIIPITGMAPIYGSIPAGVPIFAEENIEGYMPIMLKNPQEYFCLRVKGDSMINAHIISGSLVVIHHQNTAENGEIVACRVNGDEATLKRFKQLDSTVFLMPENNAYEPIIVSCKDFEDGNSEIIGVVKQTVLDVK